MKISLNYHKLDLSYEFCKKTPKYSFNKKTNKKRNYPKSFKLFFYITNTLRIYHCFRYFDFHRNFVAQLTWLDTYLRNSYYEYEIARNLATRSKN